MGLALPGFALIAGLLAARAVTPQTRPAKWTLRLTSTIGAPGPGLPAFIRPYSIVADADRTIYVADPGSMQIHATTERGQHRWSAGRVGEHQGEFVALGSLAWLGDTLVAADAGARRIALLSRAGAWLGTWAGYAPRASRLISAGSDLYAPLRLANTSGPARTGFLWLRRASVDTLPHPADAEKARITCRTPRATSIISLPYPPTTLTIPAPGGLLATVMTSRYRIALVNRNGDTVRTIEKRHQALPISAEQWAEATAPLRTALARPDVNCSPSSFERPRTLPAVQSLFFDGERRLWVETWTPVGRVFDVFDETGRHVATVTGLAGGLTAPYVRGDRLYGLAFENGKPAVRVYVIE